jgi:prefoldin subunit 5
VTNERAHKRRATLRERVAKLEGRLDAMAQAFAELTSRLEKVEVIVPNLKPEPAIPTR